MASMKTAAGLILAIALASAGCVEVPVDTGTNAATPPGKAETSAATLRQNLDSLLQEHVAMMAAATDAALQNRRDEFNAAANHLDDNAREMQGAVRVVYGEEAGLKFYDLWHTHIGYLVDYTQGVAAKDEAKKDKAVSDLVKYATDMGDLLQSISGGRMNRDMAADLLRTQTSGLKGIIDAQAAGDYAAADTMQRDTVKQAAIIGNTWANAIVQQFPAKY